MFFAGFAGLLLVVSLFLQLGLHFTRSTPADVHPDVARRRDHGRCFLCAVPRFGRKVLQGGLLIVAGALVWLARP